MKIIGLDVGEKRIGVAKVDSSTRIAIPVGYVLVDGSEWQEIARIARMNSTDWFVLGLPRSNEGNETKQSLYVRNFAKVLVEKIPGAKIRFQDESLTSVVAEERLKSRKKRYEKGEIDAEAASIILQDFIEGFTTPSQDEKAAKRSETVDDSDIAPVNLPTKPNKAAIKAKKTSSKLKKVTIFGIPIVLVILILGTILGVNLYREDQARKRAEYYAWLESQMVAEVFDFTIVPGETIFEVKEDLVELGYDSAEVDEALSGDYDFDFLKERPEGASLEGYLYGETYEFYKGASVREIITRFLEGMSEVITANNLEEKYQEQGLSLFEGITLASVVQKEAQASEQATVAQVFLSRLAYGWKLGSDVTVSYALDVVDPNREVYRDNSAALMIDSCYNTRKYTGLPCGPISNPSLSALMAVAEPSDTTYLFFLTGDDGLMYYSYTEAEHLQKAALYCRTLCNVSL